MSDNGRIAKEVIQAVGGKDNIASLAHCATRLRIMVKDKERIDQKQVENIDKVKGAFSTRVNIRLSSVQVRSTAFLKKSRSRD